MDMSKYKPLFLSETADHLDSLESELVELERTLDDTPRIHEVFRHLHSIKSMSASMGHEPLSSLAHQLEDIVAPHREHGTAIDPDEVDLLLRGLDVLRDRLDSAAKDTPLAPLPAELIEAIQQHLAQRAPHQVDPARESTPTQAHEPVPAAQAEARGPVLQVAIHVADDCSLPAVRAFVAYKRLANAGRIIESNPSVEQLRAGKLPTRCLRIRLQTDRSPDNLRSLAESLPELSLVEVADDSPPPEPVAEPAAKYETLQAEPPASTESQGSGGRKETTVRVRTELLDFFVNSVGELITLRSYFEDLSERMDTPALDEGVRRMGRVVRKLQDRVMEVRMVPVSQLAGRLPRVCRDLARSRNKMVSFEFDDEGVELDRALVEALDTPLLHLLRNAVEHGVESPDEREAAGKPRNSTIRLDVRRQQDRVMLQLRDDGRGIDPAQVLEKARRLGLISGDLTPREDEQLDLIFRPGLSTRDEVSDLSGRGVGLDVVRDALERLGGRVSVDSVLGQGTTFNLDLPLTLAILQILLIQAGGHTLALPASRVMRAAAIRADQITTDGGGTQVTLGGLRYPFVKLSRLLETSEPPPSGETTTAGEVLLVGSRDKPELALGIERVAGHRETVMKGVGRLLREVGPYNASTVLGNGRPVLILDVDALLARAAALLREA